MRRTRRLPRLLAVATALVATVTLLAGCWGTAGQQEAFGALSSDRAAHGKGQLIPHGYLVDKAQAWAEKLANDNSLSHSELASGVPGCWSSLGENVGYGSSIGQVEDSFMNSSSHRANVLGGWNFAGTGVAYRGDRVFVVQVFMSGCL